MLPLEKLLTRFDPTTGVIQGAPLVQRHLGDLRGCFRDAAAFEALLASGNPLLYQVSSVEPASGDGDLHYGLGRLMSGRVGNEYFMTKGHLHQQRDAAEFYLGLAGDGMMLLEDEASGESRLVPLKPQHAVYVPGYTAHRTVNIGTVPLVYLGIYPAKAGHDYGAIAERNFRCVVVERDGAAVLVERNQVP